jgi:hypothetical protein
VPEKKALKNDKGTLEFIYLKTMTKMLVENI